MAVKVGVNDTKRCSWQSTHFAMPDGAENLRRDKMSLNLLLFDTLWSLGGSKER